MYKLLLCWRDSRAQSLVLTCFVALAAGCVRTEHPLSEVAKIVTDDDLVGIWELVDPVWPANKEQVEITATDHATYRMHSRDECGDADDEFKLCRSQEVLYFELVAPAFNFPTKVERKGDWLAISVLDLNKLKQHVGPGKELFGTVETFTTITSTATQLEDFLAKHHDELYFSRRVFRRIPG